MDSVGNKPVLDSPKTAKELLNLYFLEARSALLETAAIFDRIERAHGGTEVFNDPRLSKLMEACEIIKNGRVKRAERFLLLFSDPAD
jgi:hypothetical protein